MFKDEVLEQQLVAALLIRPGDMAMVANVIKPEHVTHPALKLMVKIIQEQRKLLKAALSIEAFAEEWQKALAADSRIPQEEYERLFNAVLDCTAEDLTYVVVHAERICKDTAMRDAISKAADMLHKAKDGAINNDKIMLLVKTAYELQSAGDTLVSEQAENIDSQEIEWLWLGRIPLGKLTLIVGDPEGGKSRLTRWIAARVSTGTPFPDDCQPPQGSVIIIQNEDGARDTVVPDLIRHHADRSAVWLVTGMKNTKTDEERAFSLLQDTAKLREMIAGIGDVKLVIIDPIQGYFGGALSGKVNTNSDSHIRAILGPLGQMAEETGVSVLGVAHLNKSEVQSYQYRIGGSIGIFAFSRAVWLVKAMAGENPVRYFQRMKMNLATAAPGMAFKIAPSTCANGGEITWVGASAPSCEELLAASAKASDDGAVGKAAEWLKAVLAAGPRLAKGVLDDNLQDQAFSRSAVMAGKKLAGVRSRRIGGANGQWEWFIDSTHVSEGHTL